jgi:hypothetical protein
MRLKLLLACLLAVATPLTAHHGTSLYDMEKEIVLIGTVKEWSWRSPHTWLTLQVPASPGAAEEWSIESAPPAYMARQGWSAATFKPGEKLAVTISLLKGGPKAGILLEAARDTGEVLVVRPRGSFGRKQ